MPRTSMYSGDAGKVGTGSSNIASASDGGKDEGGECVYETPADCCPSCEIIEQNKKVFERENLQEVHQMSFSWKHNGSNAPYADQHAPQGGPQTGPNTKGA